MPDLSIKDVPEAGVQALRLRAARSHRSLQGELMVLIQGAVVSESGPLNSTNPGYESISKTLAADAPGEASGGGAVVRLDRFGRPIVRQGWKTVEQVAAELKAKYPHGPAPGQGSSIGMIREDRDSRCVRSP
jgi:plasmid stability protein